VVLDSIESGYRLPKPGAMPDVVYRDVVQPCWLFNLERRGSEESKANHIFKGRASFAHLDNRLEAILLSPANASTTHDESVADTTVLLVDDEPTEYRFQADMNGAAKNGMNALTIMTEDDPQPGINSAAVSSIPETRGSVSSAQGSSSDCALPVDPPTHPAVSTGLYSVASISANERRSLTTTTAFTNSEMGESTSLATVGNPVYVIPAESKGTASANPSSVAGTPMYGQMDTADISPEDEVLRETVNAVDCSIRNLVEPFVTVGGPML
jgi:hypothetical protein